MTIFGLGLEFMYPDHNVVQFVNGTDYYGIAPTAEPGARTALPCTSLHRTALPCTRDEGKMS